MLTKQISGPLSFISFQVNFIHQRLVQQVCMFYHKGINPGNCSSSAFLQTYTISVLMRPAGQECYKLWSRL